jgi:hypothetical protein
MLKSKSILIRGPLDLLAFIFYLYPMKIKGIHYTLYISFFSLCLLRGQVNTEKFRSTVDTVGFNGYTLFDLYVRTGNVALTEIGLSSRLDYHTASSVTFFIIEGEYGWQNKEQYSNEALVHLRHVYYWLPHMMPEIFIQFDYNKARLLLKRSLGGAGLRSTLFRQYNSGAWFGTSVFKEYSSFDLPPEALHPQSMNVIRWSNYLSLRYSRNELIELSCVLYYQPRIDAIKDYHILNENQVRILFSKWFSLTISTNIRYDSVPPNEIDTLDTRTKIGFGFRF